MKDTPVKFRTNIDCCKRFMGKLSDIPLRLVDPQFRDLILVYHDTEFRLELQVVSRHWELDTADRPILICELWLDDFWTKAGLDKFIQMMNRKGFS